MREHTYVCNRMKTTNNEAGFGKSESGAIAQLGERLPCTQEVSGSIPLSSTNSFRIRQDERLPCTQEVSGSIPLSSTNFC
jgi:hypothetical protein